MWKNFAVKIYKTKNSIGRAKLTTIAGAWVFYFLLAIVPLCFLIISALNFFKINVTVELINYLPNEFKYPLEMIVSTAKEVKSSATVLYLLTVLFSSTTLITQMSKDGDFIFSTKRKLKFSFLRRVGALLILILIVSVVVIGGVVFSIKSKDVVLISFFANNSIVKVVFSTTVWLLILYFILVLLNGFISPVRLNISEGLLGGFVSLSISVIGTLLFVLYVKFLGSFNFFYGVLSIILVFLLWVYILMLGIISGVLVTAKLYYDRKNTPKRVYP